MKLPSQAAPIVRGSIQNNIHSKTKRYSASSISPSAICIDQNGGCNYIANAPLTACNFASQMVTTENVAREVPTRALPPIPQPLPNGLPNGFLRAPAS